MPRPKKTEAKEPVKLRFKKIKNGNQSLYLDCCWNGERHYEFLQLYIVPGTSAAVKRQNAATLEAANTIRLQRILELTNNKAGLKNTHLRAQIRLSEWVDTYIGQQERKGAKGLKLIRSTRRLLHLYNDQVKMGNIDLMYCKGLIDWIKYTYKTRFGKPLTPKSVCDYLGYFTTILNAAVREDIIADNPMLKIAPDDRVKVPESKREYLSLDELRAMIETPCYREDVKRAYLFSCFCGLRIGDIERLKWKDLTKDGNQWRATIVMQKTTTPLYLPLSDEAMRWLPERGEAGDNDIIFNTLPTQECGCIHLKEWAKSAGVTKKITYHTARHTFATMMLTLGADIYTTSKLLGHSKVTTTQIYAKIIDPKKVETVNLTNGLFD